MTNNAVDALYAFSADLSAQDLDRGGVLLEVPKRLFLELVHQFSSTGLVPALVGPVLRLALHRPCLGGASAQASSRTDDVSLNKEAIADGFRVRVFSGEVWTIRLSEPDRSELLRLLGSLS